MAKNQKEIDIKATAQAQADVLFEEYRQTEVSDRLILETQLALWDKVSNWAWRGDALMCMNAIFHYGFLEGQRQAQEGLRR